VDPQREIQDAEADGETVDVVVKAELDGDLYSLLGGRLYSLPALRISGQPSVL